MGGNSQTTQQYQNSQFSPWGIAIPGLENLNGQLFNMSGNTSPTSQQQQALSGLWNAAGNIPTNLGQQAGGVVNNLLNSSTSPQQQMLQNAYGQTQSSLQPYLGSSYTNPFNTPGFSTALNTANTDITNNINSQFAAAGRADSPGNTQALARGLAQGDAGMIANEFNALTGQQQNAINMGQTAAQNTSSGLAQLGQIPYQNQLQAVSAMSGIPGLYTAPGQQQLGIANQAYAQPYQNIQLPLTQEAVIGGMGGNSSGYGTSTTTQPMNPFTTALGLGLAGASLFSDKRLKKDVKKIGRTPNDLGLYKFKYKGSEQPQIGLMAQDVEKKRPDAVTNIGLWQGGPAFKAVNYPKALAA